MRFKDLSKGKIFTFIAKDGHTHTAIKSGERQALILRSGEELKFYPTKKIELPDPIRGGEFALDTKKLPMLVERLKNGAYSCEYIERIGGGILPESQVSIIAPKQQTRWENVNELYITLQRLEKALKSAKNALETGKDIVEDMG